MEAKKLELMQEKVHYILTLYFRYPFDLLDYRPKPRRLLKQSVDKKNKSIPVIARWTT